MTEKEGAEGVPPSYPSEESSANADFVACENVAPPPIAAQGPPSPETTTATTTTTTTATQKSTGQKSSFVNKNIKKTVSTKRLKKDLRKPCHSGALPVVLNVTLPSDSKLRTNQEGGVYVHGKPFGFGDKIRIANIYLRMVRECEGGGEKSDTTGTHTKPVSNRDLMKAANISKGYAQKIIKEIKETATLSDPNSHVPFRVRGKGNKTFTATDEEYLLKASQLEPRPSLAQMQQGLLETTGTRAGISTIHTFLKEKEKQQPKTDSHAQPQGQAEQSSPRIQQQQQRQAPLPQDPVGQEAAAVTLPWNRILPEC